MSELRAKAELARRLSIFEDLPDLANRMEAAGYSKAASMLRGLIQNPKPHEVHDILLEMGAV